MSKMSVKMIAVDMPITETFQTECNHVKITVDFTGSKVTFYQLYTSNKPGFWAKV